MACSAVVIELPKGVFITMMPLRRRRRDVDIVDADAGAADDLQLGGGGDQLFGDLGRRADGEAVILADDFEQLVLVLAEIAAGSRPRRRDPEDLHGGGATVCRRRERGAHGGLLRRVRRWMRSGNAAAPLRRPSRMTIVRPRPSRATPSASAKAQSSQGSSASRSEVSTVAPHQMRRPGGASR